MSGPGGRIVVNASIPAGCRPDPESAFRRDANYIFLLKRWIEAAVFILEKSTRRFSGTTRRSPQAPSYLSRFDRDLRSSSRNCAHTDLPACFAKGGAHRHRSVRRQRDGLRAPRHTAPQRVTDLDLVPLAQVRFHIAH